MSGKAVIALAVSALFVFVAIPAASAARLALVIGNDDYANIDRLANAVADANAVGGALRRIGFEVVTGSNATNDDMSELLGTLLDRVRPDDEVLIYYAGHGVELNGQNFLLPIDFPKPTKQDPLLFERKAIGLDWLLGKLYNSGARLRVVILDACRNNPLVVAGRSFGAPGGLAGVSASEGEIVLFSAAAGQRALDKLDEGDSNPNGVFTRVLLPLLETEGLAITDMARQVRRDVQALAASVGHEQRPAYYDDVVEDYFLVPGKRAIDVEPDTETANIDSDEPVDSSNESTKVVAEPHVFGLPTTGGAFSWDALQEFADSHRGLSGQSLTIWGPWQQGYDQELFEKVLAYFEDATGVDVAYGSSINYEQDVILNANIGTSANITFLPQIGLFADLARKGGLVPLGDDIRRRVENEFAAGSSFVSLGTYDDPSGTPTFYGVPYNTDLKSLVWYSPARFSDAGYSVPRSLEELKALTRQMAAEGQTPWCIGLGSGGATGWPATDWVENLMLRMNPAADYDDWISNDLKFNDPKVVAVLDEFGWFAGNAGGMGALGTTDFRESPLGLFSAPPGCYMHHQASFIPAFFPEGIEVGKDVDFFYFPASSDQDFGRPVLGSGVQATITKDSEAARAFIDFLMNPISHELWMAEHGFLSAMKAANVDAYPNAVLRRQGEILLSATTFRFDASDLMPGAIGAGAFWTGMVDFVGGTDARTVADQIQATWDAID